MKSILCLLILPALLVSCGSDSNSSSASTQAAPARKKMSERFGTGTDPNGFKVGPDGKLHAQSNVRSPYESKGQDPNFAGKNYKTSAYKPGDYAKKSFWGNKDYNTTKYAGDTDGSRFQKASGMDGKGARESATSAKIKGDYATRGYDTNTARESGKKEIATHSNAGIENRRKKFVEPDVIDYQQQRALSMEQKKSILGN